MLAEYLGNEQDEMHEILKAKFLKFERVIDGVVYEIVKSTTKLTTVEFEKYNDQIRRWAESKKEDGGLEFYIPSPNEVPLCNN